MEDLMEDFQWITSDEKLLLPVVLYLLQQSQESALLLPLLLLQLRLLLLLSLGLIFNFAFSITIDLPSSIFSCIYLSLSLSFNSLSLSSPTLLLRNPTTKADHLKQATTSPEIQDQSERTPQLQ